MTAFDNGFRMWWVHSKKGKQSCNLQVGPTAVGASQDSLTYAFTGTTNGRWDRGRWWLHGLWDEKPSGFNKQTYQWMRDLSGRVRTGRMHKTVTSFWVVKGKDRTSKSTKWNSLIGSSTWSHGFRSSNGLGNISQKSTGPRTPAHTLVHTTATNCFDNERAIDPRGGQLSQTTKPTNSQPNLRRHHIQSIESDNQHHIRWQVKVTAQEEMRKLTPEGKQ